MSDTTETLNESQAIEAMLASMSGEAEVEEQETEVSDAEIEAEAQEQKLEGSQNVDSDDDQPFGPEAVQQEAAPEETEQEGAEEQQEEPQVKDTEGALQAERAKLEAQAEEVQQLRNELIARLEELKKPNLDDLVPDVELLDENSEKYDPEEYNRQQARYQKLQVDQRKADAELEKVKASQMAKAREEHEAFLKQQRQYYEENLPQIVDPEKGRAVASDVISYAVALPSVSPEDLETVPADLVHVLWKAMEYDKIQAQQANPPKPTTKKPTTVRSSGNQVKPKSAADALKQEFGKKPRSEAEAMKLFKAQMQ